jgi:hypothetical protein
MKRTRRSAGIRDLDFRRETLSRGFFGSRCLAVGDAALEFVQGGLEAG